MKNLKDKYYCIKNKLYHINKGELVFWMYFVVVAPTIIVIGLISLYKEVSKFRCIQYHEEEYFESTRTNGWNYETVKKTRLVCDKYEKLH